MQKSTKVKLASVIILVGMVCMFIAVVTDHWAVLSHRVEAANSTCEMAHFGLWRLCKKQIYEATNVGQGCGPLSLPGEVNCSYFRHFTPGDESKTFDITTQREYNISAAAIAVFSLAFMILGSLFMLCSIRKGKDYLHKPAGMFYAFAGLCAIISVEVMRQSVNRMIESEATIWVEYYYSWSFACACTAFVFLFLSGLGLLILSMPQMPRNPWETCMDAEPEQID
ncbi:calcium channel, voltage-dependent, gamma subunit 1a [Hoplias malabaricus]|uniref:calcium channel, voltage-dependent, gamma subunit 1a n=1 Tax=Hoplias malabaricus TaxID=27720 RepID=UPI0034626ED6